VIVAVVGKGKDCPATRARLAYRVAAELVKRGHTVVTGGLNGVMRAALAGAGGRGIAITPGDLPASSDAALTIRTGLPPQLRNVVTGSCCDAMVALPGSHGTWQEVAIALDRGIPVVLLGDHPWEWPGATPARSVEDAVRILGG